MRKTQGTLEQQRNRIKSEYKRGRKRERRITSPESLSEVELAVKKEAACFLKAADYSYTYIGEALNLTHSIVKRWFEEPAMRKRVGDIQQDYLDGAIKLLKTYAVELVEMLVEIARTTHDDKIAIQAITECLDRMGISKVNKSESAASILNESKQTFEITDKTGLLESMKTAPPEVQQKMAEHLEQAMSLAAEHGMKDVTHQ